MLKNVWARGAAITALSFLASSPAWAQSTASQVQEEVVVTGTRSVLGGAVIYEQAPKARQTITSDFIDQQSAGQSILNTINLVPGVNFNNNDAYGSSGGNINIRGFDGARVSLTVDGIPLNDSGNYAIYSSQQLDPELITRANVNLGTTDVDSPTASATGGTVNYVTVRPDEAPGLIVQPSIGSDNYFRLFARGDTGEIGPWGTTAWVAGSYQMYDQFRGPGDLEKKQVNARIYQPIGADGDFMSVSFHYNEARNDFYRTFSLSQWNSGNIPVNDDFCAATTVTSGAADAARSCSNFYGIRINPSNTGNIRGQSRFSLGEQLTFTFDPTFQYVRANGGGLETVSETNLRLIGASGASGADLNGDGDTQDSVALYSPSNTNTYRYGATSSLIWEINDAHRVRVGYTHDYGRHRQTGEYSTIDEQGHPFDVFGGKDGFGPPILTAEGDVFQKRNRFSIASLSQWSAEYRGDFLDDRVTVVLGVRAPNFERELNQNCYAAKGSTSSTQYCNTGAPDTHDPTDTRFNGGFVWFDNNNDAVAQNGEIYAPPFSGEVSYEDVLPNVGVTFRPAEGHQIFASYAEGLSAPRTDDLYGGITFSQLSTVIPETTKSYDLGYRYTGGAFFLSAGAWYTQFTDRIVRSEDPNDPTTSFSRNVGDVDLWGGDVVLGYEATEALTLYLAASYTKSELQQNLPGQVIGEGLSLVDTPEWMVSGRAEYDFGPLQLGVQAKWVDDRFANDFNTEIAPSYVTVDADLRWNLGQSWNNEDTYLQLNVINLLDEEFLSTISSGANGGGGFYSEGAPRTVLLTLRTQF